tara:strand:- start:32710 stop:33864 length:1155 start_codon:yes stop_codon:yes gene_type:complete
MTAANSIKTNDRSMAVAMERLSTGMRINSASDDAAGLAIATKMTSQIRGLDTAARNANDAISMIQVADGAASEITDMLQRMRELTVQSSNGVNSDSDRANLDQEFVQLAKAIDKIAETTEFNGRQILNGNANGSGSSVTFQVGANDGANEQLKVNFSDFNLKNGVSAVTETFTDANINDAFVDAMNPSGDVTLTDNLGNTITLTAAAVTSATSAGGLATLINDASGAFNMTATGTDAGGLVLKSDSAGPGTQAAALTYTGTGTPALTEVSGVNATPMTADLSAFSTTGINESDFADTLNKLDAALEGVASQRATFGAAVNTLEHTVDNLVTTSANQSAARSQIQDADYAAETTALARTQIISQAGTAMLSQANQAAQGVLALLR